MDAIGLCRNHPQLPPSAWDIAPAADKLGRYRNSRAVDVCRTCPIRETCLDDGLTAQIVDTICGAKGILGTRGGKVRAVDPAACAWCGVDYFPTKTGQRYCTPKHAEAAWRSRQATAAREAEGLVAA